MKKLLFALCCVLSLTLGLGSLAEGTSTSAWKLDYYVDEFRLPTDEAYVTNAEPITGIFSNSATTDSELTVSILLDENGLAIMLNEYGSNRVKNSFSSSQIYSITLLDDARQKTHLAGYMLADTDRILFDSDDAQIVLAVLSCNASVSFYIEETDNPSTNYLFTVADTSGFTDAITTMNEGFHERDYQQAVSLYNSGNYDATLVIFDSLGDYKDSSEWKPKYQEMKYSEAEELLAEGNYDGAHDAFVEAGNYSDAAKRVKEPYYLQAETLLSVENYDAAVDAFISAGNYNDAAERVLETRYTYAESLLKDGNVALAAIRFGLAGDYKDARQRSNALWNRVAVRNTIAAGDKHSVGLKEDGTVIAVGDNTFGCCDVTDWTDIIAISAGNDYTVGLKSDGTVVTTGFTSSNACLIEEWNNIIAISAGYEHIVGLKIDGTVVSAGDYPSVDQKILSTWSDIIAISAGHNCTVGLKADGTVVKTGDNQYGQLNVSDWTDIVAISTKWDHTLGLKSDGTIVAAGEYIYEHQDPCDWYDIISIAAGATGYCSVGLRPDGTVNVIGYTMGKNLLRFHNGKTLWPLMLEMDTY